MLKINAFSLSLTPIDYCSVRPIKRFNQYFRSCCMEVDVNIFWLPCWWTVHWVMCISGAHIHTKSVIFPTKIDNISLQKALPVTLFGTAASANVNRRTFCPPKTTCIWIALVSGVHVLDQPQEKPSILDHGLNSNLPTAILMNWSSKTKKMVRI